MIYIDIHRSRENRISHSVLRRMAQREFREVTYEKKKKNLELDIIHYLTQIGNYFFFLSVVCLQESQNIWTGNVDKRQL